MELAANTSRPITCEAVASTQDIPPRFIKAVLRDLRQAGLVRSQRGCEGGYWLARDAALITVLDAVTAVDGEHLSVRGEARPALDYHGTATHLAGLWADVQAQLDQVLGARTIAHLLTGPERAQRRVPFREGPHEQAG
ncbi:Rrf2 family transcriptional regulator [Actinokineospora diospyrosa]